MRIVYMILTGLFAAIVLVFALQNLANVTVTFLGSSVSLPVAVLVLLVYILGMVSGGFVLTFLRASIRGTRRKPMDPDRERGT